MSITTLAVRILLKAPQSYVAGIGLYPTVSPTEFHWSENQIIGDSTQWQSGIIAESGIGDISITADLKNGGGVADYAGVDVTIINTQQILPLQGINFTGLTAEIWEFKGTATNSSAVSKSLIFSGTLDKAQWSETELV